MQTIAIELTGIADYHEYTVSCTLSLVLDGCQTDSKRAGVEG